MQTWMRVGALSVAAALVGACAKLSDEELAGLGVEDVELNTTSEALLSDSGLKTLNGLTSVIGPRTCLRHRTRAA